MTSFNDRASVATTTILQIISDADDQGLDPGEVYLQIWRRLRDEFDDIAREMAGAQQEENVSEYDMGPTSAAPDLRGMKFDDTVDAVVDWFFTNFEDPAESTPYQSAEGGYIYIWGGPYDAREEIDGAFASIGENVIDAAVERIEQDGYEWAPSQSRMAEEINNFPGDDCTKAAGA
jgi:hypothetical protein